MKIHCLQCDREVTAANINLAEQTACCPECCFTFDMFRRNNPGSSNCTINCLFAASNACPASLFLYISEAEYCKKSSDTLGRDPVIAFVYEMAIPNDSPSFIRCKLSNGLSLLSLIEILLESFGVVLSKVINEL